MCSPRVSLSPFPSSSHIQHTYTTKTIVHEVTLISLLSVLEYRYTSPHVTWSAQDVHESKIDHTNAIYLRSTELEVRRSALSYH